MTTISPETQLVIDMLRQTQREVSELRNYVQELAKPGDKYMSVPDFAKRISLSAAMVRRLCETGKIKAMQPGGDGGEWKVFTSELQRLEKEAEANHHSEHKSRKLKVA